MVVRPRGKSRDPFLGMLWRRGGGVSIDFACDYKRSQSQKGTHSLISYASCTKW